MTPEQAAVAGELLRARAVAPMHYVGYDVEPHYRPAAQVGEETSVALSST